MRISCSAAGMVCTRVLVLYVQYPVLENPRSPAPTGQALKKHGSPVDIQKIQWSDQVIPKTCSVLCQSLRFRSEATHREEKGHKSRSGAISSSSSRPPQTMRAVPLVS